VQFLEAENSKMFDPTSISHIEVNSEYNVALSDDGKVYSWGFGERGRLGINSTDSLIFPKEVSFGNPKFADKNEKSKKKDNQFDLEYEKIKDAKKKVQKFGTKEDLLSIHDFIEGFVNKKEQSGRKISLDSLQERRYSEEEFFDIEGFEEEIPEEVINYEQVKVVSKDILKSNIVLSNITKVVVTQISCSDNHTLVCTNTGSVYGWGSNEYCQLGFENKESHKTYVVHPKKIFGSLKRHFIERVAAGKNHSLALSNSGVPCGWGDNSYSQLGINKVDTLVAFRPTDLKCISCYSGSKKNGIKMIRANGNYSLFLSESRR